MLFQNQLDHRVPSIHVSVIRNNCNIVDLPFVNPYSLLLRSLLLIRERSALATLIITFASVCLLTPRLLGVYYFLSAIFAKISNCFIFVFRWNRAIFGPLILHDALHKTLFFDFWFRPPTPKIDSPKFGQKSPIPRLVWQIDRRCLRLIGGFRRWPSQWNRTKCGGAAPCCHGNENLANLGYFFT